MIYQIPSVRPGDRRIYGGPYNEHRARHGQTLVRTGTVAEYRAMWKVD
jgi:hypothetical protein